MRKGTCPICKKKFKWVSEHLIHKHNEDRGSKLHKHWYKLDLNRLEPTLGKIRTRRR